MSINQASITGNVTRDCATKETNGEITLCSFTVAVNDRRKNEKGEWEEYPNFIDCVIFGKRAKALAPFIKKGLAVAVSGKLRYSAWEKDGQKFTKVGIAVDEFVFMSSKKSDNAAVVPENVPW